MRRSLCRGICKLAFIARHSSADTSLESKIPASLNAISLSALSVCRISAANWAVLDAAAPPDSTRQASLRMPVRALSVRMLASSLATHA